MHSGVHLGFDGIHQLFCLITMLYFRHFYINTVFSTVENIFFFNNWH